MLREIAAKIRARFLPMVHTKTFSQEGEDMVLRRFLEGKVGGFYVDVGAHHPKRFSNTYYFYRQGWRGINIDAMPGSMAAFNKLRPRDINIEKPVSDEPSELEYFEFSDRALNTFDGELARQREATTSYRVVKKHRLQSATLADILIAHLPPNVDITFMSIDVEGFDFKVLKSNDWGKFRPEYVLVECLNENLQSLLQNPVVQFLTERNYDPVAKTTNTVFFKASR